MTKCPSIIRSSTNHLLMSLNFPAFFGRFCGINLRLGTDSSGYSCCPSSQLKLAEVPINPRLLEQQVNFLKITLSAQFSQLDNAILTELWYVHYRIMSSFAIACRPLLQFKSVLLYLFRQSSWNYEQQKKI